MIADWYFDFVSPFSYLQCERLQSHAAFDTAAPGRVRGDSRRERPEGTGGNRRQATRSRIASSSGRRRRSAFRSSSRTRIRSIRCRCCGSRSHATAGSMRSRRSSASSGATAGCRICRSNGPSSPIDLGVPDADARIADPDVKDALRRETDDAIARGVFGVPTLAIGQRVVLGRRRDRHGARNTPRAGGRYDDAEYARVGDLPGRRDAPRRQASRGRDRATFADDSGLDQRDRSRRPRSPPRAAPRACARPASARRASRRMRPGANRERRRILARSVRPLDDHRARGELRIGERLVERQHRRDAAIDAGEARAHSSRVRRAKIAASIFAHARTFGARRELQRDEIGTIERFAKRSPEFRLQRTDGKPARRRASRRRRSTARRRSAGPRRAARHRPRRRASRARMI